eukprot:2577950-Rhodomonas_salina.2
MRCPVLTKAMLPPDPPTRDLFDVQYCYGTMRPVAYAMRYPVLTYVQYLVAAYGLPAMVVCLCYAMSGTDIGYAATRRAAYATSAVSFPISLHASYAMSGTRIAYGATCLRV